MVEVGQRQDVAGQIGSPEGDHHGLHEVGRTQWQIAWRRFRRHKIAMLSLGILILLYLSAIFAEVIAPYSPTDLDLAHTREAPSAKHWMGTDALGRDEFTRVLYGGRVSLTVGIAVAMSGVLIGTVMGAIAGYYGKFVDNVLMRITDFFLLMPLLAVLMIGSRAFSRTQLQQEHPTLPVIIILVVLFWMPVARIVRGQLLSIKEKEYVEAARASGASGLRIIWRHMLPNTLGPIIVNLTLGIALAILAETTLSYLGFGIQPPTATWGNMLAGAEESMLTEPWLVWFPGLMILITVLCVNFLGDGLRDALDPTAQRVRE